MKTKIKSYTFWTSLSAAVILLVNSLGNMFGFKIEDEIISNIIMSICGVLVVLGVVNAPTKKSADEQLSSDENIENAIKDDNNEDVEKKI